MLFEQWQPEGRQNIITGSKLRKEQLYRLYMEKKEHFLWQYG